MLTSKSEAIQAEDRMTDSLNVIENKLFVIDFPMILG